MTPEEIKLEYFKFYEMLPHPYSELAKHCFDPHKVKPMAENSVTHALAYGFNFWKTPMGAPWWAHVLTAYNSDTDFPPVRPEWLKLIEQ